MLKNKTIKINWNNWLVGSVAMLVIMIFAAVMLLITVEPMWCILSGLAVISSLIWRDLEVDDEDLNG